MNIIFIFLACVFCLDLHASQVPISDIYLGSREGDPASFLENVSTIHGEYTEVEVDVTVAAPDSLVLWRYYSSPDIVTTATFGRYRCRQTKIAWLSDAIKNQRLSSFVYRDAIQFF